jgi:signal transduction histidine kinase
MPLTAHQQVIGSLVLARNPQQLSILSSEELALMAGIAQQLGLSVENALLHEQAQRREQMLGDLLGQVVGAQEAERQRIARELHDATGQALTAIGLGLRGAENALLQAESVGDAHRLVYQVREMRTFSQSALGELHNVITDLRPPQLDDLGLAAALRWYIQEYERRRGMSTRFACEGDDDRLPPDYRTVLFRIAQEALTNIAKHADAASAEVSLIIRAGEVQLEIHDDGRGFDALQVSQQAAEQPGGWGLVGIRERATLLGGRCEIETAPGCGTRLRITAPLAPNGVLTAQAKEASQDE